MKHSTKEVKTEVICKWKHQTRGRRVYDLPKGKNRYLEWLEYWQGTLWPTHFLPAPAGDTWLTVPWPAVVLLLNFSLCPSSTCSSDQGQRIVTWSSEPQGVSRTRRKSFCTFGKWCHGWFWSSDPLTPGEPKAWRCFWQPLQPWQFPILLGCDLRSVLMFFTA